MTAKFISHKAPYELLAPAKDLECGMSAILCGADALYMGGPCFGAREAAGNRIEDIQKLAEFAHLYRVKLYIALNTLLKDAEIPKALSLIKQYYDMGIDGLIIQDMGLLECDLPPIPLIASTQTHNTSPEKINFLKKIGFTRVILARELSLQQILGIRQAVQDIELECFVHGSLCVGYSGQCYLSYVLGGRSGNRGECAQPCRKKYTLTDSKGKVLDKNYLLSLKDLNRSDSLEQLADAGITSFKIEGRLKDKAYVMNTVTFYRQKLDSLLKKKGMLSSPHMFKPGFVPDLTKTFNRHYTDYGLYGNKESLGAIKSPKMIGEPIGKVIKIHNKTLTVDTTKIIHPGDGLCFFNKKDELEGMRVNSVKKNILSLFEEKTVPLHTLLYRNHDHDWLTSLSQSRISRKIPLHLSLSRKNNFLILSAKDDLGLCASVSLPDEFEPARNQEISKKVIQTNLQKTGTTIYECTSLNINLLPLPLIPVSTINTLRRNCLEELTHLREMKRPKVFHPLIRNSEPYPEKEPTFHSNILNRFAETFYKRHGVTAFEYAAETGLNLQGRKIMTTSYCILKELKKCLKNKCFDQDSLPLKLIDEAGQSLVIQFDCKRCGMDIYLSGGLGNS